MIPNMPSVLQVQPVAPEKLTSEEIGQNIGYAIVGAPAVLALTSWFLWLALDTVHDLFPAVPPVGFWQAVTLILGLNVVANALKPRAWKWARR